MSMFPISVALIHHPVLNKEGRVVTSALTNFDLHDLARTTRTYGVENLFIVTPIKAQQNMASYITQHWTEGKGADYNPDRKEAFAHLKIEDSVEDCCLTLEKSHGKRPVLIGTTAKRHEKAICFKDLRNQLPDKHHLLIFGTGWGIEPEFLESFDGILEPIDGPSDYNHLPVRSAVAIILDRLLG